MRGLGYGNFSPICAICGGSRTGRCGRSTSCSRRAGCCPAISRPSVAGRAGSACRSRTSCPTRRRTRRGAGPSGCGSRSGRGPPATISGSAPLIIAETAELKRGIARHWRVPEDRIAVVGLGVDRTLFAPRDQLRAREALGIAPDRLVLLYVGVVDGTHDLGPVLGALAGLQAPTLELHVVGDGGRRALHERAARAANLQATFHGRVAHERVPDYIAAADLCLAPYDPSAFRNGELGYSTMKVPEYLSAGRPVATVASGRLTQLIADGETGFLVANTAEDWRRLLRRLPGRARLQAMGEAAARIELMSWDQTASGYLELCERQLANRRRELAA